MAEEKERPILSEGRLHLPALEDLTVFSLAASPTHPQAGPIWKNFDLYSPIMDACASDGSLHPQLYQAILCPP